MAYYARDDHSEGSDPASISPESRHRRHHPKPDPGRSGHRSRPEKEASHHRRTQQDHSSRSKSSHKKNEPSGFLGDFLKWTAGKHPAPKNDRRYYDSSNAWVRKPQHSSRSRSHRDGESRRHREHKEERPRSLDREHRRRERRERGDHESSREHRGERKHRSREHKGEREHRSRKDGERREHRSDRERREHRSDREHRRKREHRHEKPREPEMPEEKMGSAVQMLPSDETVSQIQTRLYRESAEVMGYDIRDQAPLGTGKGKSIDQSNPYADVAWGEFHKAPASGLNLPSGAGKTQDIIRERMSRRQRESAFEAEQVPMPAPAESQISPKTKWPPAFEATNTEIRRPSFRPLSPLSINGPRRQEAWNSAPRPPTPESPTSDYDDESVHSSESDEEEEVYRPINNPRPSTVHRRPPPPALLNNSNRRALDRASRSGPPPSMLNRGSLAPPMGRRPSGLDRETWRPASSVYSQDPPPVDLDIDLARGVREDEVTPLDSISCAPRANRRPPVPPKDSGYSHFSAMPRPLAPSRGSVYNQAARMNPASYAGTEWPQVTPPSQQPVVAPPREPIPADQYNMPQRKPLKKKKGNSMMRALKGMW